MHVLCIGIGFVDWLEKGCIYIYMRGFEVCVSLWLSLVVLRWPCAVDRTLKFNYWLVHWPTHSIMRVRAEQLGDDSRQVVCAACWHVALVFAIMHSVCVIVWTSGMYRVRPSAESSGERKATSVSEQQRLGLLKFSTQQQNSREKNRPSTAVLLQCCVTSTETVGSFSFRLWHFIGAQKRY